MPKIHVVMGHTGEYSDHTEWPILAFTSEEAAQQLVTKLDEAAREAGVSGRRSDIVEWEKRRGIAEVFQAKFGGEWQGPDYTGYDFDYFTVDLTDAQPDQPKGD